MKLIRKLVFVSLSVLCLVAIVAPAATVFAASNWSLTGPAGFSGLANYPQIDVSSTGVPYVAYCESEDYQSPCFLSVKRFNGTTWEVVGPEYVSAGNASIITMKLSPTNVPYVAYGDGTESNHLTVQRFNGTSWELVGPAGFSDGMPDGHDLAFASDGTPYVVYANSADDRKSTVARFNGIAWEYVGAPSFSNGPAVGPALNLTSQDVPFLVYGDQTQNLKLTARQFNGTTWEPVGEEFFTPGAALSGAGGVEISPDGVPYVAYMDVTSNVKMSVMRFNGTAWEQVGAAGFSDGVATDTRLTFTSTGVPYVLYRDFANGDKPTVQRFNGTSWELVGSAGFTPAAGYNAVIAMGNTDTPYVAYLDGTNNEFKMSVSQFGPVPDVLPDPDTDMPITNLPVGLEIPNNTNQVMRTRNAVVVAQSSTATQTTEESASDGNTIQSNSVDSSLQTDDSANLNDDIKKTETPRIDFTPWVIGFSLIVLITIAYSIYRRVHLGDTK